MRLFLSFVIGLAGCAADATATCRVDQNASGQAISALEDFLSEEPAARGEVVAQHFASTALCADDAARARELLWEDFVEEVRATRQSEVDAKEITIDGKTMRYDFRVFGDEPADGHSLYISMHGGGGAPSAVNDSQWRNQIGLYQPDEGIYLAPRAPTDTWNLWHQAHIDPLFQRLIANMVVFHGVNPNRVYLMGYSAGGDGVYQVAPRMADRWAAAAMMAGHPNEARPDGLRNTPFTIHVGALDGAYNRNTVAAEWGDELATLNAADPEGYTHEVHIHEGRGHWMHLDDAVAVPWMAQFNRRTRPNKVVWFQDDVLHDSFYWLARDRDVVRAGDTISATLNGQRVDLDIMGSEPMRLRFDDAMLDLEEDVEVWWNGEVAYRGPVQRTIGALARTLAERQDPNLMFSAELDVVWAR